MDQNLRSFLDEITQSYPNLIYEAKTSDFEFPTTINFSKNLQALIYIETRQQISECLSLAQKHKIKLSVYSGGKNWGYGSKSPSEPQHVVLDLTRMNRVLDFDSSLHTVTIEPGVTQRDLQNYLKNKNLDYMVPTNGAGPHSTLVGNLAERGYGLTPIEDRFTSVLSLTVLLPTGEEVSSPLSEMGSPLLNSIYKWGTGPYLDGIFTQSNLGIIVGATLAIKPRPEQITTFLFQFTDDQLESIVAKISKVKEQLGTTCGGINLMNDRRLLSMIVSDGKMNSNEGPLSQEEINSLKKEYILNDWGGLGTLYGPKDLVRAAKKIVKQEIKPHTKRFIALTSNKIRWAKKILSLLKIFGIGHKLYETLLRVEQGRLITEGIPSEVALPLAYLKSGKMTSNPQGPNPAEDGCGLIWYSPLVPMLGHKVSDYVAFIHKTCLENSIEPLITLTTLDHRVFDSTIPILFDKESSQSTQMAHNCFDQLFEKGRRKDFIPYRYPIHRMNQLYASPSTYWDTVRLIKKALDPNEVLSSGRYCPSSQSEQESNP